MSDLLRTSLYENHVKCGAKLVPFAGWEMPIQYSSVKDEVEATRKNVGIFDVSHMGEFIVEGEDAFKFVDHIITNDFAGAEDLKAVYSPLCRENGTVIDDLIAYKLAANKVLICVNAANIKKDWDWISSQVTNFNCTLTDHSNDYSLLAIQGPNAEKFLEELGLNQACKMPYYSVLPTTLNGADIIIARTGYTGEDGFEIFSPANTAQAIWSKALESGVTPCGLAARDVLRLEVCYPLYGHELNDEMTPLDSALKWTVRLNKSNFIGKEALESSTPKWRLIKLSVEKGIPREGYPIVNETGEEIGKVSSGTFSPTLGKGIALALVKKDLFPADKTFAMNIRNKTVPAKYHAKPFIVGGHK